MDWFEFLNVYINSIWMEFRIIDSKILFFNLVVAKELTNN